MQANIRRSVNKKNLSCSNVFRTNKNGTPHYYIDVWGPKMKQKRLDSTSLSGLNELIDAL